MSKNTAQSELATLLQYTSAAVVKQTLDGTIASWNRAAERVFGYPPGEMIGKPISTLIHPEDRDPHEQIMRRARTGERVENCALRTVRKDGSVAEVSLSFAPLHNEDDVIDGLLIVGEDLNQWNRLEEAERDQLFLSAILSSAEDAIISKNLDGIVNSWNRGAQKMYGYTSEEMIGKPISILVPPDHPDEESQILERIRRGDRIEHYETRRVTRSGRIIDISLTVSPIKDRLGQVVGASHIARDISDRARMEQAERDQLFLASLIYSADDGIISKNLDGIVTSWNHAAEKIFGYTADEMIGKPIELLIPADHPDEEQQILQRLRRGERIEHYETRRRRKDGQIIDVSVTISPVKDSMGRIIGVSKIARDISDRKRFQTAEEAQSFLGALVASAEDAIISKTLDGIVTSWNPAAERIYGYTAEEMIGKPIALLIPSDHPDEEPAILERIRQGRRIEHYETKRVRKDGGIIDVSLTVSPVKDSLGRIVGASKIARDITPHKEWERREQDALRQAHHARQQAEEARRQAVEASRAKDEFLATVSHELRTPMTAILGWSRMLMTGELSPERQLKAIETIDRNARSQAQLIEDLLDISRIVSGKLRVDLKTVDLTVVIAAAVEAVRPAAETKRIAIQTVLSSSAGPILGDFERLQQIVWNLLSNAIRFTPAQGSVQIQLQRVESQIELRVIDNGAGINPDLLPHIFNRFTQADSSITRSSGGLGMGLAIVKSLVEIHGGVVSAASEGEGRGSTFVVKLPVAVMRQSSEQQRLLQRPSLQPALKGRHELVGVKILVVDDEADTADLLRFVFRECGAIVETANSAQEALELFVTWQPDILVSDIGMPELDGFELIRILREERQSRIPAVALTAMARIDDRVRALTAGYQMHVAKPVEPVELVSIVGSLVSLVNRPPSA